MLLRVNPNRMELLRLKKRLVYAQRGHDLLEDRLQQMIRHFMELLKKTRYLQEEVKKEIDCAYLNLLIARLANKKATFLKNLDNLKIQTDIHTEEQLFFGIKMPLLKLEIVSFSYPPADISLDWQLAVKRWVEILPKLIRLTQQIKTCQLLAEEIEHTRRRVNALKYLLIPSLLQTIHFIADKLNELERTSLLRLLRIKEIIRKH
ncbi:MAG: V-type ATP synthase subunit D [Candidatus Omnitrophica bacterium]|nr:V-type ATP synthase subunit D [Candidatus Omnitrophota bacterium]